MATQKRSGFQPKQRSVKKNSNFENLKKQAKALHKSLAHSLEAKSRVSIYFDDPETASLQNVQLVIARENGFKSWAQLKAQIAIAAGIAEAPEQGLAQSIIKSSDVNEIEALANTIIQRTLGWQKPYIFRFEMSVGIALGIEDTSGQRCLLKILGPMDVGGAKEKREFQAWLYEQGFPCPKILQPVTSFDGVKIVIEQYRDTGRFADGHLATDRNLMANALHSLVSISRCYPLKDQIPTDTLEQQPNSVWPKPHNVYFDFEATRAGAAWIDKVAEETKPLVDNMKAGDIVAHVDWSAKHFRIENNAISVIYDWDSVARVTETRAVGAAAANFAYSEHIDKPNRPTLSELRGFLSDYQSARAINFSAKELKEIWACIKYTAAYGARCEHAIDHANPGDDARSFLRLLITQEQLVI